MAFMNIIDVIFHRFSFPITSSSPSGVETATQYKWLVRLLFHLVISSHSLSFEAASIFFFKPERNAWIMKKTPQKPAAMLQQKHGYVRYFRPIILIWQHAYLLLHATHHNSGLFVESFLLRLLDLKIAICNDDSNQDFGCKGIREENTSR